MVSPPFSLVFRSLPGYHPTKYNKHYTYLGSGSSKRQLVTWTKKNMLGAKSEEQQESPAKEQQKSRNPHGCTPKIGVPQKWMVYNGKNPLKWMIWGETRYFRKHPHVTPKFQQFIPSWNDEKSKGTLPMPPYLRDNDGYSSVPVKGSSFVKKSIQNSPLLKVSSSHHNLLGLFCC